MQPLRNQPRAAASIEQNRARSYAQPLQQSFVHRPALYLLQRRPIGGTGAPEYAIHLCGWLRFTEHSHLLNMWGMCGETAGSAYHLAGIADDRAIYLCRCPLPFGRVKHNGNGQREGLGALDFFTTWKAVYVDYSDKLQRANR
jgi:hypothetical protein